MKLRSNAVLTPSNLALCKDLAAQLKFLGVFHIGIRIQYTLDIRGDQHDRRQRGRGFSTITFAVCLVAKLSRYEYLNRRIFAYQLLYIGYWNIEKVLYLRTYEKQTNEEKMMGHTGTGIKPAIFQKHKKPEPP